MARMPFCVSFRHRADAFSIALLGQRAAFRSRATRVR